MEMWQIETKNLLHYLFCFEYRDRCPKFSLMILSFILHFCVIVYAATKDQNPLPMTVEIQISVDEAVNQIIWSL